MMNWGRVALGTVLQFMFTTYDGATGASEEGSGLAVTDIEIYKAGGGLTQRSSDAGYALLDADGHALDSIVGLAGFTVDTGDNTDAGFFVAGGYYIVVVASVTVDAQTVNFIAGTFSLGPTLTVAGVEEVDVTHIAGAAVATTTAHLGVNIVNAAGTAWGSGAITAGSIATDAIGAAELADGAITAATFAAGAIDATAIANGAIDAATFAAGAIDAAAIANNAIDAATFAADVDAEILSYLVDDATRIDASDLNTEIDALKDGGRLDLLVDDIIAKLVIIDDFLDTEVAAILSDTNAILVDTAEIGVAGAGLTALATQASVNTIDDFLDTEIADILTDTGTTLDDFIDTEVAAIKTQTDKLTFTLANHLDVNLLAVNGTTAHAAKLGALLTGHITGAVNAGVPTTTSFIADGFTEATNDHFNGRLITWTSGALLGQQTDVTDYVGATQTFTVTAMTEAPADNDTFIMT